jgi:hypothetical protein
MRRSKPEPIAEHELYDAEIAAAEPVVPLFPQARPDPESVPRPEDPEPLPNGPKRKEHAEIVSLALDILSFRLILLLCTATSGGLFFLAALWPDQWRLAAAAAFSVLVTAPSMFFYHRR